MSINDLRTQFLFLNIFADNIFGSRKSMNNIKKLRYESIDEAIDKCLKSIYFEMLYCSSKQRRKNC